MNLARRVRIINPGSVYPSINQTNALSWPTEEIKALAGRMSGWGRFDPASGDEGTLIWASVHPDSGVTVYLVAVRKYYVAIGEDGVEFLDGQPPPRPI
jgi:hypothetical protein